MSLRSISTLLTLGLLALPAACAEEIRGDVELVPESRFPVWMFEDIGPIGIQFPAFGVRGMNFGGALLYATPGAGPGSANAFLAARVTSLPGGELAARVLASPSCLPDVVGNGIDTDGDGIPDDRTATYTEANCTVYDTATADAYLVRGVFRLRDNTADRYGFEMTLTDFSVRDYEGSDESYQTVLYNVTETARLNATGGTYRLILDAEGTSADIGGPFARKIHYDLTEGFVPQGSIPVGGPIPDGGFTISGNADISTAGVKGAARVKVAIFTTQPMLYDAGCGGIDTGGFQLRLNGSTTEGLNIRFFAGCHGGFEPIGAGVL